MYTNFAPYRLMVVSTAAFVSAAAAATSANPRTDPQLTRLATEVNSKGWIAYGARSSASDLIAQPAIGRR